MRASQKSLNRMADTNAALACTVPIGFAHESVAEEELLFNIIVVADGDQSLVLSGLPYLYWAQMVDPRQKKPAR